MVLQAPDYGGPQVAPAGVPGVALPSAVVDAGSAVGGVLLDLGAERARRSERAREVADRTAVIEASAALTQLTTDALHGPQGLLAKRGPDAFAAHTRALSDWNTAAGSLGEKLASERARRLFGEEVLRQRVSFERVAETFIAGESARWADEALATADAADVRALGARANLGPVLRRQPPPPAPPVDAGAAPGGAQAPEGTSPGAQPGEPTANAVPLNDVDATLGRMKARFEQFEADHQERLPAGWAQLHLAEAAEQLHETVFPAVLGRDDHEEIAAYLDTYGSQMRPATAAAGRRVLAARQRERAVYVATEGIMLQVLAAPPDGEPAAAAVDTAARARQLREQRRAALDRVLELPEEQRDQARGLISEGFRELEDQLDTDRRALLDAAFKAVRDGLPLDAWRRENGLAWEGMSAADQGVLLDVESTRRTGERGAANAAAWGGFLAALADPETRPLAARRDLLPLLASGAITQEQYDKALQLQAAAVKGEGGGWEGILKQNDVVDIHARWMLRDLDDDDEDTRQARQLAMDEFRADVNLWATRFAREHDGKEPTLEELDAYAGGRAAKMWIDQVSGFGGAPVFVESTGIPLQEAVRIRASLTERGLPATHEAVQHAWQAAQAEAAEQTRRSEAAAAASQLKGAAQAEDSARQAQLRTLLDVLAQRPEDWKRSVLYGELGLVGLLDPQAPGKIGDPARLTPAQRRRAWDHLTGMFMFSDVSRALDELRTPDAEDDDEPPALSWPWFVPSPPPAPKGRL